jgi:hypothetical protein
MEEAKKKMEALIKKQQEELEKTKAACHTKAVWIEESQTCFELPFYFGKIEDMIELTLVNAKYKKVKNSILSYQVSLLSSK